MLFRLIREREKIEFKPYIGRSASELGLVEKDLENWMAEYPELLFGGEQVLVIDQSVSGQRMADILALDADGRLVIVEIKRDWSDRATVGQLLEYAADMAGSSYGDLEKRYQDYWNRQHGENPKGSFLERVQVLTELDDSPADLSRRQPCHRICIVAPDSDEGLRRIVDWLKTYGVPISFVPFTLYADTNNDAADILLEIEPLPIEPLPIEPLPKDQAIGESSVTEWQGDWFFNTNETYAPGAYTKMFDQGVIAVFGGPWLMGRGIAKDQRVFAYVNRKGILAVGHIVDGQVVPGTTVFDDLGREDEFHVKVDWETIVLDKGITNQAVPQNYAYNLPRRNVFCKMYRPEVADWIACELRRRKS